MSISRVSDQNGLSLLYIMLEIHHSGREPSICETSFTACCSPHSCCFYTDGQHLTEGKPQVSTCNTSFTVCCSQHFCCFYTGDQHLTEGKPQVSTCNTSFTACCSQHFCCFYTGDQHLTEGKPQVSTCNTSFTACCSQHSCCFYTGDQHLTEGNPGEHMQGQFFLSMVALLLTALLLYCIRQLTPDLVSKMTAKYSYAHRLSVSTLSGAGIAQSVVC